MGLRQSYSRWFSQLAVLTSGGPSPTDAYAIRTPSEAVQKRISCSIGVSRSQPGVGRTSSSWPESLVDRSRTSQPSRPDVDRIADSTRDRLGLESPWYERAGPGGQG